MTRTVHAVVTGRVQGVGFRAFVLDEASTRGLRGWVRNRSDGAVEALFSGPHTSVDAVIVACRSGPVLSRVADVAVTDVEADAGLGEFTIRSDC